MINSLYTQSVYSFNGSVLKLETLISTAQKKGTHVALADQHLHAAVPFLRLAKAANLTPLLGIEILIETSQNPVKALLYARGEAGYYALLKCETIYAFKGHLSMQDLKEYQADVSLIIWPDLLQEIDLENIHTHMDWVYRIDRLDISCNRVLRNDEPVAVERLMKSILNTPSDDSTPLLDTFQDSDALADFLAVHGLSFTLKKASLPRFKTPEDISSMDYLKALAKKGLKRRLQINPHPEKPYLERLDKELSVIESLQYEDYFLIVWDIIKEARRLQITVGPGRGSAPGSLVAYALGITHVDPIEHGLLFERFLNQARKTMPDIDLDFPDDERDQLLQYLNHTYGKNHVALIATFGTFLTKSSLRDSARVLDIEKKRMNQIMEAVKAYSSVQHMIQEDVNVQDWMNRDEKTHEWLTLASYLEGYPKHIGTHAAGVILSEEPLTDYTALSPGLSGMSQTQLEQKILESMDLLKIDLLGLRNLSLIRDILAIVNPTIKRPIELSRLRLSDAKTYEAFKTGSMNGIFQMESPGMRRFIKRMQPDRFEDIVALLALYRPGPMESINEYLKRRKKESAVPSVHPSIDPILEPTYGIIIYQEQIMRIATDFAGYTLEEADLLRRAVSKKDRKTLEEERGRFIKTAITHRQDKALAESIYDLIVRFADYGFNRSHSVAYAMIAYWMMYLKAHHPGAFLSVMMRQAFHQETLMHQYIMDAKHHHLDVLGPNILESGVQFKLEYQALMYPLSGIKNIGQDTVQKVIDIREEKGFDSYLDFIQKTQDVLNTRQWTFLIYAGALDVFNLTHQTMIENLEALKTFAQMTGESLSDFKLTHHDEYPPSLLESHEKMALSINIKYHVYHPYQKWLNHPEVKTLDEAFEQKINGPLLAAIARINPITTKQGDPMAFLTLKGRHVEVDAVIFPEAFKGLKESPQEGMAMLNGGFQYRQNKWQYIITKVKEIPSE